MNLDNTMSKYMQCSFLMLYLLPFFFPSSNRLHFISLFSSSSFSFSFIIILSLLFFLFFCCTATFTFSDWPLLLLSSSSYLCFSFYSSAAPPPSHSTTDFHIFPTPKKKGPFCIWWIRSVSRVVSRVGSGRHGYAAGSAESE